MHNKIYHHRRFLSDNQLSPADLSEGIRHKIRIFDGVEGLLSETFGAERQQMELHLMKIDLELIEDLIDYFFDNTDEKPSSDHPPIHNNSPQNGDEEILMRLWKQGRRTKLPRSLFIREGIKQNIQGTNIPIGSFMLVKSSVFRNIYDLKRLN